MTTNYYYDGGRVIEECDGLDNDTLLATYVHGNGIDELLQAEYPIDSDQHPISGTYYFHENTLGSIYAVTDNNGVVVERYEYSIYGKVSFFDGPGTPISDSAIGNCYLFTGREYDPETGLFYYRARYYSPVLGRFINRDPMEDDNLSNLYAYVENDPINSYDPFGTDKWKGQINAGVLHADKLNGLKPEEKEPVKVPLPNPQPLKSPTPELPVVKCDKGAEYNIIYAAVRKAIELLENVPAKERNKCNLWQRTIWNLLRVAADESNRKHNRRENGEFEHWKYDAVNIFSGPAGLDKFWNHVVVVWQKGTNWKNGIMFEAYGGARTIPPTPFKGRRKKDKIRGFDYEPPVEPVPPQPYKWGEKYR